MHIKRRFRGAAVTAAIWTAVVTPDPAAAQPAVVRVTVTQVTALDCLDPAGLSCAGADFYAKLSVDGETVQTPHIDDATSISPNWTLERSVARNPVPVQIEIWESDSWFRDGDDPVDLKSAPGRSLNLSVDTQAGRISGNLTGKTNTLLTSAGTQSGRARITFRIDVVTRPRLGELAITVERLTTLETVDDGVTGRQGRADYYVRVAIDGIVTSNRDDPTTSVYYDHDELAPYWTFKRIVNLNRRSIPFALELMDADNNADDRVDIQPGLGRVLHMTVTPSTCRIQGDVTGRCAGPFDARGRIVASGEQDDRARIQVRVELRRPPPFALRCLHSPLWPRPGQTVSIRAEALDSQLDPVVADGIQIGVAGTGRIHSCDNAGACTLNVMMPAGATRFDYICQAQRFRRTVTTGLRQVAVGARPGERAVPILRHQPSAKALDLVFLADLDTFSTASETAYLGAVEFLIRSGLFRNPPLVLNQQRLNLWIAKDLADANGFVPGSTVRCSQPPSNWTTAYGFADSGIVVHQEAIRDCADFATVGPQGQILRPMVSTPANSPGVLLHELGHMPFGLADEYCCDGGYFQTGFAPNVYASADATQSSTACRADPLAALLGACGAFTENRPPSRRRVFRLDHPPGSRFDFRDVSNDLMVDDGTLRPADVRRFQHVFRSLP